MQTRSANRHARTPRRDDSLGAELLFSGGSLVHRVSRELSSAMDRELAAFDLTGQQAAVLLLATRQQVSPSQLTERLGTGTAGMTRLLDRLEAKGLLTRSQHPEDRRAIIIEPTAPGRALIPRLAPIFRRVHSQLLAGLPEDEVVQLTTTLQHMLDNVRRNRPQP